MLGRDVVDGELDQGDPVVGEGLSVGADGRVAGGFQQELRTIRVLGGDHGEPEVVTQGDVVVDREAEDLGVEVEGGSLVVDVDAGEADLHYVSSRRSGSRHRSAMTARGSALK